MIRFRLTLDIKRLKESAAPEPEELLPGGTSGNAQVEHAGYQEAGLRVGFNRPEEDM